MHWLRLTGSCDPDALVEWQRRGMAARSLCIDQRAYPVLRIALIVDRQSDARLSAEAWLFGWRIEDASRSGRRASEAIR